MKRFAGTGFNVTERLVRTAVKDCQKFEVDKFVEWRIKDDGKVQLSKGAMVRVSTGGRHVGGSFGPAA